jgi:hypothetical protein
MAILLNYMHLGIKAQWTLVYSGDYSSNFEPSNRNEMLQNPTKASAITWPLCDGYGTGNGVHKTEARVYTYQVSSCEVWLMQ